MLAPTRELATQIDDEVQGFAYHAPVASAAVYGGVPMGPQERALKAGVDIVVATPGRLLDHMRSNIGDFSKLEIFVLDEADRMMDMGFWPDVRKIAEALPPSASRQTMLFSATMPEEVMRFADALAPDAVFVQVGSRRGPAQTITHEARVLPAREKAPFLAKYLRREAGTAIVFVNTKIGADRLARQLGAVRPARGARSTPTGRRRSGRTSIESFRAGRTKVLVATDVAARGLDIDAVGLIVNYEVPHTPRHLRPSRRPHRPQGPAWPRPDARRSVRAPGSRTGRARVRVEAAVVDRGVVRVTTSQQPEKNFLKGMKGVKGMKLVFSCASRPSGFFGIILLCIDSPNTSQEAPDVHMDSCRDMRSTHRHHRWMDFSPAAKARTRRYAVRDWCR